MKIAQELKSRNIAEYLIYMWQMEDLMRAYAFDLDRIRKDLVSNYPQEEQPAQEEWYGNLLEMMRAEGVMEKGHLQINRNVLINLTDLHNRLLASSKFPFYNAAYFKCLPFIVHLRQKDAKEEISELEICFDAIYGYFLLRLQKKEIFDDTQKAIDDIKSFLSLLANYYDKEQKGELKIEE